MHVIWSKEDWKAFKAIEREGPIQMLNLIRFREQAAFEDGRTMTGKDAYAEYGRRSAPIFQRVGGRLVWRGKPEHVTIGAVDEQWDLAFIAEYPSAAAFMNMIYDADYQKAVENRTAAVLDSRLIRMEPLTTGENFASI